MSQAETQSEDKRAESRLGFIYASASYLIWGVSVIYWKWLEEVGAVEVLSMRVLWAAIALLMFLGWKGRLTAVWTLAKSWKNLRVLCLTSVLLGINWSIFVWSVLDGNILQASLGYYINPLFSVLLGVVLLAEKISRLQIGAVVLATIGVLTLVVWNGTMPWLALSLTVTWGFYGYIRKRAGFVAMDALLVELGLCMPVALGVVTYLTLHGQSVVAAGDLGVLAMLMGGGLVTLLPLAFFGEGVARIRLSTMGILQYIAPTTQFLLAVAVYGEPLTPAHLYAFGLIWTALVLYSFDVFQTERMRRRALRATV